MIEARIPLVCSHLSLKHTSLIPQYNSNNIQNDIRSDLRGLRSDISDFKSEIKSDIRALISKLDKSLDRESCLQTVMGRIIDKVDNIERNRR